MKNYSVNIARAIEDQLTEMDMKLVAFDEVNGVFSFVATVSGEIAILPYIIHVNESSYRVIVRCPVVPVEPNAIMALMEFVCRANYGSPLLNGRFEVDCDTGEVRYIYCVECDDEEVSQDDFLESIVVPGGMIQQYASGILKVLYEGLSPKTAIEGCENATLVHIHEAAERALRTLLEERRSCGELDISDEEIEDLFA